MIIDIKRITKLNSRNQVFIGLDPKLLEETVFEPGSHVNVIYEKDKITIVKDIEGIKNMIMVKNDSLQNDDNKMYKSEYIKG